jgi:hypothetical protein
MTEPRRTWAGPHRECLPKASAIRSLNSLIASRRQRLRFVALRSSRARRRVGVGRRNFRDDWPLGQMLDVLPTLAPCPASAGTAHQSISTWWPDALEQAPGFAELRWFEFLPAALDLEQGLTGGAKQCTHCQHGAQVRRDDRRRPDSGVDLLDFHRELHVPAPLHDCLGRLRSYPQWIPAAHRQPPKPQRASADCMPGGGRAWIRRYRRRPRGGAASSRASPSYSAKALRLPTDRLSRSRASSTLVLVASVVDPVPCGRRV